MPSQLSLNRLILLLCCFGFVFSCKAPKNVIYFENSTDQETLRAADKFDPVFKPNDLVSIVVSSPDAISAQPFNQGPVIASTIATTAEGMETSGQNRAATYLIDSAGNIEFPVLGTLHIGGLTRIEAKKMLSEELKTYIKNPIVSIRITNYNITIIGEVSKPGNYVVPNERVTIIEAIGLAGDLTITGRRKNVLVRREEGDAIKNYRLDLTSKQVAESPAYFLEQNDVVYVEPNKTKVKTSKGNKNTLSIVLSLVSVLLTVVNIIIRTK